LSLANVIRFVFSELELKDKAEGLGSRKEQIYLRNPRFAHIFVHAAHLIGHKPYLQAKAEGKKAARGCGLQGISIYRQRNGGKCTENSCKPVKEIVLRC